MVVAANVTKPFQEFFVASASVAGALIGLLFVAISVSPHQVTGEGADPGHRVRAAAALTAFTNALVIALFALIPGEHLGGPATVTAAVGVLFVLASLLSLVRGRGAQRVALRDMGFLVGMIVLFAVQLSAGITLWLHDRTSAVHTIAVLTVVCFLVGIARAWELIGASSIRLHTEVIATMRGDGKADANPSRSRAD